MSAECASSTAGRFGGTVRWLNAGKLMLCSGTGTVCSQARCSAAVGWLSSTATAVRFMVSRHCLWQGRDDRLATQMQHE